MANDKAFKIKNGLSATRYLQSGTAVAASDVDMSSGSYFTKTLSANTTFTFSNPPPSGTAGSFALEVTGADVTLAGYDLANAAYDSVSLVVTSQETSPTDVGFKPDGTKMYVMGNAQDAIHQYSLSTAYDLSTASSDSVNFSFSGQDTVPLGFQFNNDGTKMFMVGNLGDSVYQYSLSTAYDISTISYDNVSFSVTGQETSPTALTFDANGTKMYVIGAAGDAIHQYSLSTGFDLSTAFYDSVSFSVSSQDTIPYAVNFNNNGTKMYVIGASGDSVYQYSTTGLASTTITYPSSVKWAGATTPDAPAVGEKDVYTFVTTDGGTTYYGKQAGDAVA